MAYIHFRTFLGVAANAVQNQRMDNRRQFNFICRARDLLALFAHAPDGTMREHMLRMGADERPEFFAGHVRHWCPRCIRFHTATHSGPVQRWRAPECQVLMWPNSSTASSSEIAQSSPSIQI